MVTKVAWMLWPGMVIDLSGLRPVGKVIDADTWQRAELPTAGSFAITQKRNITEKRSDNETEITGRTDAGQRLRFSITGTDRVKIVDDAS
jgi:hypothetical protein